MAKILIAAGAAGSERLRSILDAHHNLFFASTVQEALDISATSDLLVCGFEFDESRMFDFLRVLNKDPVLQNKPRLCVRFFATNTPGEVIDGLELAARAVGAREMIDVPALEEKFGADQADEKIRESIEAALNGGQS
jgi:hypothetical protein